MFLYYKSKGVFCDLDYSSADDEEGIFVTHANWEEENVSFTPAEVKDLEHFMLHNGYMLEAWDDYQSRKHWRD